MVEFDTLAELAACVGKEVALTGWHRITQADIDGFAQVTGDQQWIHVDPERARQGPFGTPVAHGFFTLSLLPRFFEMAYRVHQVRMGINYGLNRVRFTAPVPVDSLLRARMTLLRSEAIDADGLQLTWAVQLERQGSDRPVCVAESVVRLYP